MTAMANTSSSEHKPKRIVYFSAGMGAGGAYRALALRRAFTKLETEAGYERGQLIQFVPVVLSDYAPLFNHWQIPAITGPVFDNPVDRGEFLKQAIRRLGGCDALLTSYHISAAQRTLEAQLPTNAIRRSYLILRQFRDMSAFLTQQEFEPGYYNRVFTIEPEVDREVAAYITEQGYSRIPKGYLHKVGPTVSIWPSDLLPHEEARRALLEQAGQTDQGKPLMLVCHNGTGPDETRELAQLAEAINREQHQSTYQVVLYSQTGISGATFDPFPVARYFQGVDHLVAVPGYNTYWEWLSYSRPTRRQNVSWIEMGRAQEDIARRAAQTKANKAYLTRWKAGERNGAKQIAKVVLGDLAAL